jgi:DNA repair photolyase
MKITEVNTKSILTKSNLPGTNYVINPYGGCSFACAYCYADFMRRFSGHLKDNWGEYVDVRINAPELLDKEIKNVIKKLKLEGNLELLGKQHDVNYPNIFISSVCDPYQAAESKYRITRECLEILVKNNYSGEISILTKSPLVTRDIDLLKKIKNVDVGLTITSADDKVTKLLEKNAPPVTTRLRALKILNDNKIKTYTFVGPVLPHFIDNEESLDKLFKAIKQAGTSRIYVELLNLSGQRKRRLLQELEGKVDIDVIDKFWFSQTHEYKTNLKKILYKLIDKYKMKILGGRIIDHEKYNSKN